MNEVYQMTYSVQSLLGDANVIEFNDPYTFLDDGWTPGCPVRKIARDEHGYCLTLVNDLGWELPISGVNPARPLRVRYP